MKKILLLSFIMGIFFSLDAQIFTQNFSSSTTVSDYVSATPSAGQFEGMSPNGAALTSSIENGALRFARTATAGIYLFRNFTFTTNPTFVRLKFDFEASNFQTGTQTPVFSVYLGNTFSSASSGATSNYASRFGIYAQTTAGEYKVGTIDNIGGAPQSSAFTGKQTITFVVNNSGSDKTYIAPDGNTEIVGNTKMDVWVGTSIGINDFSLKNTDAKGDISGFKIQATSASGTGVFDFDNIELTDLTDVVVSPSTDKLPDTPAAYLTLKYPHIWTSYAERQKVVDNVNQYEWAKSYYTQLKGRVDAKKNAHKTDPSAILNTIPAIPGISTDRYPHNDMLTSATESALLYFLTDDKDYAQYAADILSHYTDRLSTLDSIRYTNSTTGLFFSDWWLESRALFPKIAMTYDFLYNYVNDAGNTVYDLGTSSRKAFNNQAAQTTVKKLAAVVFKSIQAPHSNHSILAGNGALFNVLMIDDQATQDKFFSRYYNTSFPNDRFDTYTWSLSNFTEQNIWDETFGYSVGSHQLMIQSLNIIDRIKPEMNIIDNNLRILDGFSMYENWFYPSRDLMRFGDTGAEGDLIKGYQWILAAAARKNMGSYIASAAQTLQYEYTRKGGQTATVETESLQWQNPLELLWGINIENTVTAKPPRIDPMQTVEHAGLIIQRNYNTPDSLQNGMMCYSGGAAYVHTHSTGIDLELYGKGYVLGAESGSGTYGSDEHENYRVRHAAHNTVIANGSGKRGTNWDTKMSDVTLIASEPKVEGAPISDNFSFSAQEINDTYNSCLQQRTVSIIRTSPTSAYYFDLFRSKGNSTNLYHDYIYHNIGDEVALNFTDATPVPLSASSKYATDASGSVTGWTFFQDVNTSAETNMAVNATFAANSIARYMNVFIPKGISREYAVANAPKTKGAIDGYDNKLTPVMTMRKNGEAWNEPFVAVYEPTTSSATSVKSISYIIHNSKVVGARVVSEVNGAKLTDCILSNDVDNEALDLSPLNITFTGRFAIVRASVKDNQTNVSLYIGKGQQLTFEGTELNADGEGKALSEYVLNYAYEFPFPTALTDYADQNLKVVYAYPNPSVNGMYRLSEPIEYKVFNLTGGLIAEDRSDIVDLSSYQNGIYLLHVNNQVIKLLKS